MENRTPKSTPIASYTFKELAELFSVNVVTLRRWLNSHFDEIGKPEEDDKFSPRQVEIIFEILVVKEMR